MRAEPTLESIVGMFSCILVSVSLGVYLQASKSLDEPMKFCTNAKLVTAHGFAPEKRSQILDDPLFFNTVISIIESEELRRRALDRVRALHPDLKEVVVQIEVIQPRDTAFLNLTATGPEPKYTKIFLNSLIDEFITVRQEMREKMGAPGSDIAVLERASAPTENLSDWMLSISLGALMGGLVGVILARILRPLFVSASSRAVKPRTHPL